MAYDPDSYWDYPEPDDPAEDPAYTEWFDEDRMPVYADFESAAQAGGDL